MEHLRLQGLSPATLQQRLAAISSFYAFSVRLGGSKFNPVQAVSRPRRQPFPSSRYLTAEEASALLRIIPRYTIRGKRDYALFLAYLATGRRNTEIRTLRWGDLEPESPHAVWYRWQGKGSSRRDQCPLALWNAVLDYLSAAGRLKSIKPADYIFTPLTDRAARLPNVDRLTWTLNPPLSMREIGRLLKKYALRAGLDPSRITVHTLRHTAAMLRRSAGDDLEQISAFLGQASLWMTHVYLHRLEGQADNSWLKVAALLGLSEPKQGRLKVTTQEKGPYGSEELIAHTYGVPANARLIAAAPDLLEAAKGLLSYSGLDWQITTGWKALRAAIDKAEGR